MSSQRLRLVVMGMMGRCPYGGQSWLYLNWLRGLSNLGHDVYYAEDDTVWPYDPERNSVTDDGQYAARHLSSSLARIGLSDRWAFRLADRTGACWGMTERQLDELYASCDALLNIGGAIDLRDGHLNAPFRVYVETDPVTAELRLANGDAHTREALDNHHQLVTYGENYGAPDCRVPLGGLTFAKTRQPVDLSLWPAAHRPDAESFTTIGNYRQEGGDVTYNGETFFWSKHHEWEKFIELPRLTQQRFRLAMLPKDQADRTHLETHGWQIESPLQMSLDIFGAYQDFFRTSRAEFTVAKDQNVRLRSGWFSDRDACYLATGKPVVAQDTGFSNIIPCGEGLFAFRTMDDVLGAIDSINRDYDRQCRAARQIAEEYFETTAVSRRLLRDIGLE